MRIAIWVKTFPARYETFIANQVRGLVARGHDLHVFAARAGENGNYWSDQELSELRARVHYRPFVPEGRVWRWCKAAGIAVSGGRRTLGGLLRSLRAGPTPWSPVGLAFEASSFRRQAEFDVLHCQYAPLGALAVYLRQLGLVHGRIVTAIRGYDMRLVEQDVSGIYSRLFAAGDLFLPVCDAFRQRLIAVGCPAHKVVVHRSGIDCGRVRAAAGVPHPGPLPMGEGAVAVPTLVTVGRLVEKKGHEYVIRAVAGLRERFPDLRCAIVGDGPLRDRLQRLIADLNLQDCVQLLGALDHAATVARMATAWAFVLPSVTDENGDQEGIPNALKEAMLLGVPVVSTGHSGIPELVEDGVSGFLVAERDVEALADRLQRLLEDGELRRGLGVEAQRRVQEQYDCPRLNDQLEALFAELKG